MSRVLVLYGTTDGHTGKIAGAIAATLRQTGLEADVVDARRAGPAAEGYDGVVVAASVRAGRYPRRTVRWVERNAAALNARPSAFVSVCLGVLQRDEKVQRTLTGIIDRFLAVTRWRPTMTRMVAGALLYRRYNPIVRWWMTRIVRKAGGDIDTSRDYEYTDWDAVRVFAEQFARLARSASVEGGVPSAKDAA